MIQRDSWPQYRKFSAAPRARDVAAAIGVCAAAVAVLAIAWQPEERMMPPADMHVVTYVQFPRVEIVGQREHAVAQAKGKAASQAALAGAARNVDAQAVKFVEDRQGRP